MTGSDAVAWLLASRDATVRYLTLRQVIGESPQSRRVRASYQEIPSSPRVRALLAGQRRDGGFGVHPYRKWTGAFWRLLSLVELAIPPGHPAAVAAAEQVLGWLASPQHRRTIRVVDGRVRQHASQEGYALAACCHLGMATDRRARTLASSLLEAQWPDGGWNCDPRPGAAHSSFHETIGPLWGLAEYARATDSRVAAAAAERAAEFLLAHRLFRSHRTGQVIHGEWLKLHYPPYWHYDFLRGLLTVSRCGRATDPRVTEALDLLEAKRGADGRWRADGRRYWRPPGSTGSNVEAVDWGPDGQAEMLTLNALQVLSTAGRLR